MNASNILSVIARRKHPEPVWRNRLAAASPSPTALQMLVQGLAALERKVDALAIMPRQPVESSARGQLALASASPMALQPLMQTLAELEQKVDALATKPRRKVVIVSRRPKVQPQEDVEEFEDTTTNMVETPEPKVNRSRLWAFFD